MTVRTPLVGFNDNIDHLGKTCHVQTEDSAGRRSNVITHLFADGGRIVTSTKSSYKDLLDKPDADTLVRGLMLEQHRTMLLTLERGEFDALLGAEPAAPTPEAQSAPAPAPVDAGRSPGTGRARTLALEEFSLDAVRTAAVAGTGSPEPGREPLGATAGPPMRGAQPEPPGPLPVPTAPRPHAPGATAPVAPRPATAPQQRAAGGRPGERTPAQAPMMTDRRPTPPTGGAYRFVGDESPARSVEHAEAAVPPRKRRYPQTNPGRLRRGTPSAGGSTPAGGATPWFPSRDPFGSQIRANRRLDELIIELVTKR